MPRKSSVYIKCSVDGCDGNMVARGWCQNCYYKWKRHGTTENARSLEYRLNKYTNKDGPIHPVLGTKCWVWTGYTINRYGATKINDKLTLVHRYSWESANGPILGGLDVCHHCDNPPCINPEHLFLGTDQDNKDDCVRKFRQAYGERNGRAILTEVDVAEIRQRFAAGGITYRQLGNEYGVCRSQIEKIVTRKMWSHVA